MDADEITFSGLFERHRLRLQAHCYRMVGSFEDSEDLDRPELFEAFALPISFPLSRRSNEDEVNAKEV